MRHFFNIDYLIETIQYSDRAHLKIMWLELDVDGKSYKCGREIIEQKKKIMKKDFKWSETRIINSTFGQMKNIISVSPRILDQLKTCHEICCCCYCCFFFACNISGPGHSSFQWFGSEYKLSSCPSYTIVFIISLFY